VNMRSSCIILSLSSFKVSSCTFSPYFKSTTLSGEEL
jgi:hypothetical protein